MAKDGKKTRLTYVKITRKTLDQIGLDH